MELGPHRPPAAPVAPGQPALSGPSYLISKVNNPKETSLRPRPTTFHRPQLFTYPANAQILQHRALYSIITPFDPHPWTDTRELILEMAPALTRKRKTDESPAASPERSPIKKRKLGISLAQKQALIDNLQLESECELQVHVRASQLTQGAVTERARRLRAQYNVQAQQLRSRVEMRVNRIPTTLRKLKMSELFERSLKPQQSKPVKAPYVAKPPPVPAKDGMSPKIARKPVPPSTRGRKRLRYGVYLISERDWINHAIAMTFLPIRRTRVMLLLKIPRSGCEACPPRLSPPSSPLKFYRLPHRIRDSDLQNAQHRPPNL